MAELIKMPTLGFDMEEGTMGAWMKKVGDAVAVGDVLAEIESDKVTQELTARAEGVLLATFMAEGDIVPVGADLGVIGAEGEDISGLSGGASAPAQSEAETTSETEEAPAASPAPVTPAVNGVAPVPSGEVFATPVARRIARDNGVDLATVAGSGPGGRVRKADIEAFLADPSSAKAATPKPAVSQTVAFTPTNVPTGPETTEVPLTRLRKAIARRMTESHTTIPAFYVTTAIDMTDALALRKQVNGALPEGEKVSVNDLIVKACGLALRAYPNLNASFGGDKLILHNRVNVGIAVAVEGGLLTVVNKNTDMTPLAEVARQNRAVIGRARDGKVQAEDIQGSTFSVSNLGGFGVDHFIAIINPPESAILAVGAAEPTAVLMDGEFVQRSIMKATCSADHRVTDGAEVAQFLAYLKEILETPLKLLL